MTSTPGVGKFSFAARIEGNVLFVAASVGLGAEDGKPGDADNLQIRLRPRATVSGILIDSNGSANDMPLTLTMFHEWQRGGALVNLQGKSTTDAQGRFSFSNVPPERLELQRMVKMTFPGGANSGYTYQLQTWFVANRESITTSAKCNSTIPAAADTGTT